MPRNGSGVYSLPAGYTAVTGETATATQHNSPLEDFETDANTARPIVAGGTGATTAAAARDNLLVSGKVATKSTNYTALTSDRGKVLRFDNTYTLSLTAAATLGDGWTVTIIADGGTVTVDPDGSETIDGATTKNVFNGEAITISCNGTAFYTSSGYEAPRSVLGAAKSYSEFANLAGAVSLATLPSFTQVETLAFTAQSTTAYIVGTAGFTGASTATTAGAYVGIVSGSSGTVMYTALGNATSVLYATISPVFVATGLTVGTSYTAELQMGAGASALGYGNLSVIS
jgi:hypothetical protein